MGDLFPDVIEIERLQMIGDHLAGTKFAVAQFRFVCKSRRMAMSFSLSLAARSWIRRRGVSMVSGAFMLAGRGWWTGNGGLSHRVGVVICISLQPQKFSIAFSWAREKVSVRKFVTMEHLKPKEAHEFLEERADRRLHRLP